MCVNLKLSAPSDLNSQQASSDFHARIRGETAPEISYIGAAAENPFRIAKGEAVESLFELQCQMAHTWLSRLRVRHPKQ